MNAATWTVTVSLTEADAEVFAQAVLHAGGKVFEGSGTAVLNPRDVVRPAPGAAQATERALLDLVESIRCARLQRFAVGGLGPMMVPDQNSGSDAARHNGFHAAHNGFVATGNGARGKHNGAARDRDGLLGEFSG